jgi:hypothetical protein
MFLLILFSVFAEVITRAFLHFALASAKQNITREHEEKQARKSKSAKRERKKCKFPPFAAQHW